MSFRSFVRSLPATELSLAAVVVAIGAAGVAACAQGVSGGTPQSTLDAGPTGDDDENTDDDVNSNTDANAFGDDDDSSTEGGADGASGSDGATGDDDDQSGDDSSTMTTPDSGGGTVAAGTCASLASGDLIVVELMIASVMGSTDNGEWVEIQNSRTDCSAKLSNITVSSPRGTSSDSVTITDGTLIPPGGTFVVADSASASVNHNLPSPVYSWGGTAGTTGALANGGDEVIVKSGSSTLDDFTYPAITFNYGKSIEFSASCPAADRSDLSHWDSNPTHEYSTTGSGFFGTPNGANTDSVCN